MSWTIRYISELRATGWAPVSHNTQMDSQTLGQ